MLRFCDDEHDRCLVVPESMKLDNVIPSKLGKSKLLVFIKLAPIALKMESIMTDVSELTLSSKYKNKIIITHSVLTPHTHTHAYTNIKHNRLSPLSLVVQVLLNISNYWPMKYFCLF